MRHLTGDFVIAFQARAAARPAYRQLYAALRTAILDGRLRPGVRLPSTRDLAKRYRLSRGTIIAAFEQRFGGQGSAGFIQKPFTAVHLAERVKMALSKISGC